MVAVKNKGGRPDDSRDVPTRMAEEDVTAHINSKEEGGFVVLGQEMSQTLRRLSSLCECHFAALCDIRAILPTTDCSHRLLSRCPVASKDGSLTPVSSQLEGQERGLRQEDVCVLTE